MGLVGRGNLNRIHNKLICKKNIRFVFLLEYLLEYLHQRLIRIRFVEVMLPVALAHPVAEVTLLGGMSIPRSNRSAPGSR